MLRHILILSLIIFTLAGTTQERIDKPKASIQDLTSLQQYTFMTNETVQIDFPSQYSAFEGKVYDRASFYNQTTFSQDFAENSSLYKQSSNCLFQPAYFELETEEQILEIPDYKIISHVVDWANKCAYLLTEDFVVLKTHTNNNDNYLIGYKQGYQEFGRIQGVSSSLGGMFFNESNGRLYVFSRSELFVWNNSHFMEVIGYVEKEYSDIFIVKNEQLFILHAYNKLVVYNFTDEFHCKPVYTINKWRDNNLSPVDFKFVNEDLWVLDSQFGLYTFSLKLPQPDPKNSYVVRFGKKLFFEVNDNVTFLIAFELNGDTYVAEMALILDVLYLNRFYDKINGVKEIVFFEQRVAIIGEQQMMTIQHSTNPALLADTWQMKDFYAVFGLIQVQPKRTGLSPEGGVLFTMIKGKQLVAVTYTRKFATVTCNFNNFQNDGYNTVYIELNSTVCKANNRTNMSISYCNIKFNLNFKIVGVISSLLSLIITIVIIILAVLIFVCLLVSARRMKSRKQMEIEDLQKELKKRMEQEKKGKEVSEGIMKEEV